MHSGTSIWPMPDPDNPMVTERPLHLRPTAAPYVPPSQPYDEKSGPNDPNSSSKHTADQSSTQPAAVDPAGLAQEGLEGSEKQQQSDKPLSARAMLRQELEEAKRRRLEEKAKPQSVTPAVVAALVTPETEKAEKASSTLANNPNNLPKAAQADQPETNGPAPGVVKSRELVLDDQSSAAEILRAKDGQEWVTKKVPDPHPLGSSVGELAGFPPDFQPGANKPPADVPISQTLTTVQGQSVSYCPFCTHCSGLLSGNTNAQPSNQEANNPNKPMFIMDFGQGTGSGQVQAAPAVEADEGVAEALGRTGIVSREQARDTQLEGVMGRAQAMASRLGLHNSEPSVPPPNLKVAMSGSSRPGTVGSVDLTNREHLSGVQSVLSGEYRPPTVDPNLINSHENNQKFNSTEGFPATSRGTEIVQNMAHYAFTPAQNLQMQNVSTPGGTAYNHFPPKTAPSNQNNNLPVNNEYMAPTVNMPVDHTSIHMKGSVPGTANTFGTLNQNY